MRQSWPGLVLSFLTSWPKEGILRDTLAERVDVLVTLSRRQKTKKKRSNQRCRHAQFTAAMHRLPVSVFSAPFPAGTNTVTPGNGEQIELSRLTPPPPLFIFFACFMRVYVCVCMCLL